MIEEINRLEIDVFNHLNLKVSNIKEDLESEEYLGYNFDINHLKIKFRRAKVTPKKVGLFVTLWQRNSLGITAPFNHNCDFDFFIIYTKQQENKGFFLFPKSVLIANSILSTPQKEGKRGFRVYPVWDIVQNKQAIKTQAWQVKYFYDLKDFDSSQLQTLLMNHHHKK